METLVTKINLYKEGTNPFFSESVTYIELEDEAVGAFIKVSQDGENLINELRFDLDEIDKLCEVLQAFKKTAKTLEK